MSFPQILLLDENLLFELPCFLACVSSLKEVGFSGNNISFPPPHILQQDWKHIRKYLQNFLRASSPKFNERNSNSVVKRKLNKIGHENLSSIDLSSSSEEFSPNLHQSLRQELSLMMMNLFLPLQQDIRENRAQRKAGRVQGN